MHECKLNADVVFEPLNKILCPTFGTKSFPGPSNLEHEPNLRV